MGLQNERIVTDDQLTASSSSEHHGPELARPSDYDYQGSWIPRSVDKAPYIQVDFGELKYLSGVVTQGEGSERMWVTAYKVYFSVDGTDFYPYSEKQDGVTKIFTANTDANTHVTNYFVSSVFARYIRIEPVSSHFGVALRFDVLGCNPSPVDGEITPRVTAYPATCAITRGLSYTNSISQATCAIARGLSYTNSISQATCAIARGLSYYTNSISQATCAITRGLSYTNSISQATCAITRGLSYM